VDSACHPRLVDQRPPAEAYWILRFPDSLAVHLSTLEQAGDWDRSAHYIARLLREDAQFFGPGSPLESEYRALLQATERFVDSLGTALHRARAEGVPGAARFVVQQDPIEGHYALLDHAITVTDAHSPDAARSLCWAAHNIHRLHGRLTAGARLTSQLELQSRVNRWNAFNERGLTPFPWELALNEAAGWLGTRQPLEPPVIQVIALRPSVGVELDSNLGGRTDILAIEALGLIGYVNDRRWYVGASALWTSPAQANPGFGVLIHLTPWLKTGPVWRDVNGDGQRQVRVVLSLDAFDILQGAPRSLREAAALATDGRAGH
jgi:hypothetical protein